MTQVFIRMLTATLIALATGAVVAADIPDVQPTPVDKLATARSRIAQQQWTAAIEELKRVNDPASADWNNLMGYSHRKSKTPDLAAAERYYNEALRIDPRHRGALEYSGELYLMKGDLGRAEQRLQALATACPKSCEELDDLKAAVNRYRMSGNTHVAKP
jgi:Flp pilus assembly protein TadD